MPDRSLTEVFRVLSMPQIEAPADQYAGDLRERLVSLFERARAIDLRRYEAASTPSDIDRLVELVSSVLEEARERVHDASDFFAQTGSRDGAAPLQLLKRDEDASLRSEPTTEQARHLCSGILLDLRLSANQLEPLQVAASAREDREEVLTATAACLHKIRKAATAVDRVLAQVDGHDPALTTTIELESSLRTRKEYVHYRRAVMGSGPPSSERLLDRLCRAAIAFMRMQAKSMYCDLRLSDRLELQAMHERVSAWVEAPQHDLEEGRRLWQDCAGLAELLKQINLRSDLIDHDKQLMGRLVPLLAAMDASRPLPDEIFDQAKRLLGRDDAVDSLILQVNTDVERWREGLARALSALR